MSTESHARPSRINWKREWSGPLIALLAVVIIFAVLRPSTFLTWENFRSITDQATIPLILAMGSTFVILAGCIDLSIEGVMATAALTYVLLSMNSVNTHDLGLAAPVIAILAGVVLGWATGIVHTMFRVPSFMVSLGIWFIGLGIATVLYGDAVPQLTGHMSKAWASSTPLGFSNAFVVAVVFVVLAKWLSNHTTFGRYTYAIGADEHIAKLNGVAVARYKVLIFTFAGFCSAFAGVIGASRLGVGIVDVGSGQLFQTIAAVVIGGTFLSGGRGGVLNSACGVLLVVVITNGLILMGVSPVLQRAVSGLVIVAAVVVTGLNHRSRLRIVK
ncbi:ABC transporter permease [Paraburkholderia phenoliruptrix]|uniref:ABC transporter permease n=1 Tax=Paraburkholderia phenoliruptrix TaxID=252970 RepID=UPI002869AB56|nr:ABC transporter permease [Paraburkholderia phenoliruptrix]WMY11802.1 ABC transporter permease [Paraburkholderia phenoliruptrix]